MFSLRMDAFGLALSPRAAGRTVLYFGLIFLLVMGFSGIQISRDKLLDLMQGGRKNEELRPRSLRTSVLQLVLGGVCLAAAYACLLYTSPTRSVNHPVDDIQIAPASLLIAGPPPH